jgi:hypothetical protein
MPKLTGGSLCGAVRYISGAVQIEFSCHCRDCQYVSGGAPKPTLSLCGQRT